LYAGIQMSPDEVVGSRDGCCHSIAESTVDVPIRLFCEVSEWLNISDTAKKLHQGQSNS